jgi:hypothetical protein
MIKESLPTLNTNAQSQQLAPDSSRILTTQTLIKTKAPNVSATQLSDVHL